jgi:hypothetical protein
MWVMTHDVSIYSILYCIILQAWGHHTLILCLYWIRWLTLKLFRIASVKHVLVSLLLMCWQNTNFFFTLNFYYMLTLAALRKFAFLLCTSNNLYNILNFNYSQSYSVVFV